MKENTDLTMGEAAKAIGVNRLTLKRWEKRGYIKCTRIGPRGDRRFTVEEVERILGK